MSRFRLPGQPPPKGAPVMLQSKPLPPSRKPPKPPAAS
jgi:hypothetical protein